MPGHVFVVHADIRKLACDAWLLPCSRSAQPREPWFLSDYDGLRQGQPFKSGDPRVQLLREGASNQPSIWLGLIGMGNMPISWYVEGAEEFLDTAAQSVIANDLPPRFRRFQSLLALPVGHGWA
jgi:hypothetical protein